MLYVATTSGANVRATNIGAVPSSSEVRVSTPEGSLTLQRADVVGVLRVPAAPASPEAWITVWGAADGAAPDASPAMAPPDPAKVSPPALSDRPHLLQLANGVVLQVDGFWLEAGEIRFRRLGGVVGFALGEIARLLPQEVTSVRGRLPARFVRRLELPGRLPLVRRLAAPRRGSRFAHQVAAELEGLPGFLERGPFEEGIEMRYPFLHRPLVEHALRLPPPLRIRPTRGKHVLREAMRGILPEEVRTRRGKGGIDARLLWALHRERARLDGLLRDPEIARRGWVRAGALRAATEQARQGEVHSLPFLLCSLSLETWLAVRSGRWEASAPGREAAAA